MGNLFNKLKEDIRVILFRNPAAKNIMEAVLCYPGFHALIFHRIAHRLYKKSCRAEIRLFV